MENLPKIFVKCFLKINHFPQIAQTAFNPIESFERKPPPCRFFPKIAFSLDNFHIL